MLNDLKCAKNIRSGFCDFNGINTRPTVDSAEVQPSEDYFVVLSCWLLLMWLLYFFEVDWEVEGGGTAGCEDYFLDVQGSSICTSRDSSNQNQYSNQLHC